MPFQLSQFCHADEDESELARLQRMLCIPSAERTEMHKELCGGIFKDVVNRVSCISLPLVISEWYSRATLACEQGLLAVPFVTCVVSPGEVTLQGVCKHKNSCAATSAGRC